MKQVDIAFGINAPNVVARVMDDEAILIAFATGSYYSSRGSGGLIVEYIQNFATLSDIVGAFAASEAWPQPAIERDVIRFANELLAEGLIVQREGSEERVPAALPPSAPEFSPPRLEKYSDLEDLLVLDPIHDVDAAGWPIAKGASRG